ncbi:hypothetical protein MKEN_00478300 [Mycena kentingensis (nom. inval.)]|nr:hypothetical protein MKEN_00478300 [Mycena kentingensis (nom. inval.)]
MSSLKNIDYSRFISRGPDCNSPFCRRIGTQRCAACKQAFYCSVACQKIDWKLHKQDCRANAALAATVASSADMPRPRRTHCTGCNIRFNPAERADIMGDCKQCGMVLCESCVCHEKRGTCYCENSNFGKSYCKMEPRWYHASSKPVWKAYHGDRHPAKESCYEKYSEEPREEEPRECGNCGQVERCFKAKFL